MDDRRRPVRKHHREQRHHAARASGQAAEQNLIFGIHAVEAALANPQREVLKLYLTDNAERRLQQSLAVLLDLAAIESGAFHVKLREVELPRLIRHRTEAWVRSLVGRGCDARRAA